MAETKYSINKAREILKNFQKTINEDKFWYWGNGFVHGLAMSHSITWEEEDVLRKEFNLIFKEK